MMYQTIVGARRSVTCAFLRAHHNRNGHERPKRRSNRKLAPLSPHNSVVHPAKPVKAAEEAVESPLAEEVGEVAHVDDVFDECRDSGGRDTTCAYAHAVVEVRTHPLTMLRELKMGRTPDLLRSTQRAEYPESPGRMGSPLKAPHKLMNAPVCMPVAPPRMRLLRAAPALVSALGIMLLVELHYRSAPNCATAPRVLLSPPPPPPPPPSPKACASSQFVLDRSKLPRGLPGASDEPPPAEVAPDEQDVDT